MAAGPVRDDEALVAGFERWLAQCDEGAGGELRGARVEALRRPSSGWTNETVMVDLAAATSARSVARTVVVRMPPIVSSFPDQDVAFEASVLRALASTRVPVPSVFATELDAQWLGAPFAVMACIDGHVVGDVPAFDEWLDALDADGQRARHEEFVAMLATLHGCDISALELEAPLRAGISDEVAYWERYLAWSSDGAPTRRLADALAWCRDTEPRHEHANHSLLWGDARIGNVIWRDARVRELAKPADTIAALIDWEGASVGPPEMDLGWYLALDALTTHFVGRTVPGFLDRTGVVDCYENALGRSVEHLEWHEVFALVRSTCINECQARLAARTGTRYPGVAGDDNPVLDYMWSRIDAMAN